MANKPKTPEASAPKKERKIPIEKMRRSCDKLFGISPSTFDGATLGMEGSYTVEEMKAHITAWLNKPVGGPTKEGK